MATWLAANKRAFEMVRMRLVCIGGRTGFGMGFVLTLLILCVGLWVNDARAQSPPSHAEIEMIFNQQYAQNLLFYKPHDYPIEIERSHQQKVNELDEWVALDLLIRKKTRFVAEKIMYGEPREVSVGGYEYALNQQNPYVSDQGFFYGRPFLKQIFTVSKPVSIGNEFFCEVYLSWYVVDIPDWLGKFKQKPRLLRRVLNSQTAPFEKSIHLIQREGKWRLWDDKGKQTLF